MQVSISVHREAVGLMLTNFRVGDRVEDKEKNPHHARANKQAFAQPMLLAFAILPQPGFVPPSPPAEKATTWQYQPSTG